MDDGIVESVITIKAESPNGTIEYKHEVSVMLEPVSSIGLGEDATNPQPYVATTKRSEVPGKKLLLVSFASTPGWCARVLIVPPYPATEDTRIACPPVVDY